MIEVTMSGHDHVSYIAAEHVSSLGPRKKGQKFEGTTIAMIGDVDDYFYVEETAEEVRALVEAELNHSGAYFDGPVFTPINSENEVLNYGAHMARDTENYGVILRASCEVNGTPIKTEIHSSENEVNYDNLNRLVNALGHEVSEQLLVGMAPQLQALIQKGKA